MLVIDHGVHLTVDPQGRHRLRDLCDRRYLSWHGMNFRDRRRKSSHRAPGMCEAWNVMPVFSASERGKVASSTMMLGSRRRAESQYGSTRGGIEISVTLKSLLARLVWRAPETVGQLRLRQRMRRAGHRWRAWPDTSW